ncbi:MAG: multidrug resistance protein [Burkholderiales bacterium]|jgi:membrane dipeptidase|nr:multidrug resistance protein [Burkholderiales bacterium]
MNTFTNAKDIKANSIIADIAMDFLPEVEIPGQRNVLERYKNSGFSYLNIALGGDLTSVDTAIHYIARQRQQIGKQSDQYIMVKTVDDILRAKQENKLALGFWFQGATPLAKDLNLIETYYLLGIRQILLAYNTRNEIGDGILEKNDAGLSTFGYKVIEEMNRVGMLIDLSHAGIKTSLDVIEASHDPVIFSHSNAQGVNPHPRNLTDEQIKAVSRKNGVIGINGMGLILGEDKPTVKKFVSHIDYISNLLGSIDNIALGLDLVYFQEMLPLFFEKSGINYPSGYLGSMDGIQPEQIDEIIETLLSQNYSKENIIKILGNNFLRVASIVWK